MKRKIKIVLFSLLGVVLLCLIAFGLFVYKAKYGFNFYETDPPELPEDLAGKTVLLFSKTNGFRHGEAIEASLPVFEQMAETNGWSLFITDNGAVFNKEQLERFDVVIWNNTSGKVLNEDQREDFKNYMENGGGFIGIHASGDDSHQWEWYENNLIGAKFSHHTLHPQFQLANMHLEQGDLVLTMGLPALWEHEEEWYTFFNNPRENGFQVLYTLDESGIDPSGSLPLLAPDKDFGMGADHPIVWYKEVGKGRAFYSALGHKASAFDIPENLKMLRNAIHWAGNF